MRVRRIARDDEIAVRARQPVNLVGAGKHRRVELPSAVAADVDPASRERAPGAGLEAAADLGLDPGGSGAPRRSGVPRQALGQELSDRRAADIAGADK